MGSPSGNPVASLAALLQESYRSGTWEQQAGWLLARGVQYAPREHEMAADHCLRCGMSGASISFAHPHENECRGAPPREPPPPSFVSQKIASEVFALREFLLVEHGAIGWVHTLKLWYEKICDEVARGRPEGPSAPAGPWKIEHDEHGETRRGWRIWHHTNGPELWMDDPGFTEAEAQHVCDALNRVGSRPPDPQESQNE